MKQSSSTFSALLATGRSSNLPTVWSNCLVTMVLIWFLNPFWSDSSSFNQQVNVEALCVALISSSLFYLAGCFLGDAFDVEFDKQHKPERPIPAGIISRKSIFLISICLFSAGIVAVVYFTSTASSSSNIPPYLHPASTTAALLLSIILYSALHKKSAYFSLPLIGLCRFFLILFAASIALSTYKTNSLAALNLTPIYLYAAAVCIYTISFASVARSESNSDSIDYRTPLRYLMLSLPLLTLLHDRRFHLPYLICLVLYALWTTFSFIILNKNKGIFVAHSLAGFCLLDACFIAAFDSFTAIICAGLFALALLLQKFIPAT